MEEETKKLENVEIKSLFSNSTREGNPYTTLVVDTPEGEKVLNCFDTRLTKGLISGDKVNIDYIQNGKYLNVSGIKVLKEEQKAQHSDNNNQNRDDIRLQNAVNGLSRVYMGTGVSVKEFALFVKEFVKELYNE